MRIRSRPAIVGLLTGVNLFNYLDRYLVNAVSPRIQSAFALPDSRTGWVMSAFMLGYFLAGPVFGALGDRRPRKSLIAGGVLVWSIATAATGLAGGFVSLLAVRIVVGAGEASDATLSPTIIDDLTDAKFKSRVLAIFYAAMPVGAALGYVAGGQLERLFGWRSAFYVVGLPGLALALLVLLMDEPARRTSTEDRPRAGFRTGELLAIPRYRDAVLGYAAYTFGLGAFAAWAPKYVEERLSLPLHIADLWLGATLAVTGLAGTLIGGLVADRWPGADRAAANLKVCAVFTGLAVPFVLATLLTGSAAVFFTATGAAELFLFVSTAPVNAALLGSVPRELRASAMATSLVAIHLLGDLVSPPIVGTISDLVRAAAPQELEAGRSLRAAMLLLPAVIALGAALWWRAARRSAHERPPA
jgi:MFS transporter, Spinster family, sphingosine-1-phosphate transporter